jgi:hypothetical protein
MRPLQTDITREAAMNVSTEKWIKDGQYMVEIKGKLAPEEQELVDKYGDMRIDLSSVQSSKSYSTLSAFATSGSFDSDVDAEAFVRQISEKLKAVLEEYRALSGDFEEREVHGIEGLELIVMRKVRHHNYQLHISIRPNAKSRELIEKYGDPDIDISTEKFTSHVQPISPQSPKLLSLRIDKNFENAVDARDYENKIIAQIEAIMQSYIDRKDTYSGREETTI